MKKRKLVKEISGTVFGALTDLLLWYVYLVGASWGKSGPRGVYQAFAEADKALAEVNHRTLVATWHLLTKKRLITHQKRGNLYYPAVTDFGRKRLEEILPAYHRTRPWDGKIYLVTYDIPEIKHYKRDMFRGFLVRIGCKLLAESVFLTPYNPRELINEFVKDNSLPGTIIVSDVGTDGGVGETSIQDLVVKLYQLEILNDRYDEFIKNVKDAQKGVKELILLYLSILKDDPQLPFPLLPKGWLGEEAYTLSQSLYSKTRKS